MSDDFFEELEKNSTHGYLNQIRDNSNKNTISTILKVLCWIIIIGGFIVGTIDYALNENVLQMFTTWLTYGICSLGGFALAEIIQILHDIRNKIYSNKK